MNYTSEILEFQYLLKVCDVGITHILYIHFTIHVNCSTKESGQINNLVLKSGHEGSTPRRTNQPTVGCNVTLDNL
jgi:hypothetical protein